jgi:hypothetical protein
LVFDGLSKKQLATLESTVNEILSRLDKAEESVAAAERTEVPS